MTDLTFTDPICDTGVGLPPMIAPHVESAIEAMNAEPIRRRTRWQMITADSVFRGLVVAFVLLTCLALGMLLARWTA